MSTSKIDTALGEACRTVGEKWEAKRHCCEDTVRQSPLVAVAGAVAAGYVLNLLPVSRIAATLLKILITLLKPALLIYGAARVAEYLRESCPSTPKAPELPAGNVSVPVGNP